MENDLSSDNRLASTILNTIGAVVCVMNTEGKIVLFNQASQNLTGYTEEEALGRYPWDFLIAKDETDRVKEVFRRLTLGNFPNQHMNYWLTRNGEQRLISWSNTALADTQGNLAYVIATGIDITEKKAAEDEIERYNKELEKTVLNRTKELQKANQKLESLAYHDALTGLHNRHYFDKALKNEINRARRQNSHLALMICDIDHFKEYNDLYGHIAGDKCLKEVANEISRHFHRAGDLVVRFGGEEFCIVLPNTDTKEAQLMAEQLRESVFNRNIEHNDSPVKPCITISIGVCSRIPDSNCKSESLLQAADMELYKSKKNGRNQTSIYIDSPI